MAPLVDSRRIPTAPGVRLTRCWSKPDSNLYGAFPVKWCFSVYCQFFVRSGRWPFFIPASWSGPQPTYRIQVCGVRYASIASSPRISSSLRVLRRQGAAKHKRR